MSKFSRITAATMAAVLSLGASALAAPLKIYDVSSAVSDDLHGGYSDHAVWLPIFDSIGGTPLFGQADGSDFDFSPVGRFVVYDYGTASLTGRAFSQIDTDPAVYGFDIQIDFALTTPPASPKLELDNSAYASTGGPIDPSTWQFYTVSGGSISGIGELAGLELSLEQFPTDGRYPLQVGYGANNKNGNFGISTWFRLSVTDDCTNDLCDAMALYLADNPNNRGDINVDLTEVPLPAAGWVFLSGLAGLWGLRRRRASK